jgi:outer membrane protein assembly factor BamE (lipoprotein component of BamABCDE complex)
MKEAKTKRGFEQKIWYYVFAERDGGLSYLEDRIMQYFKAVVAEVQGS